MKISEKCRIDIEGLIEARNKFKMNKCNEPYSMTMWGRDFASILELYTAYKLLVDENNEMKERLEDKEKQIRELKKQLTGIITVSENLDNRIIELKDKLEIVRENLNNHIIELKDKLYKADEENTKLKEKVSELHTIKKSFEVLRALYLGDYENDEPF